MKTRFFCTYFDHNYLPRAMVMLESLYEHNPHALVFVLCLSSQCYDAMQKLAYPFVRLISMHDFEAANPDLVAVRPTRSLVEYYFTMTPCLPWHILHTGNGIDAITYLDADMMFFSSVEPIFEEAGDASVILTPHNFAPHLMDCINFGIYNVSWLTFAKTNEGIACLAWYKEECLCWCYDRYEHSGAKERFADQKYLDYFHEHCSRVHPVRHLGAGLAPWNITNHAIYRQNGIVYIESVPLIFFHAQAFKHLWWRFYASGLATFGIKLNFSMRICIYSAYIGAYKSAILHLKKINIIDSYDSVRYSEKFTPYEIYKKIKFNLKSNTLLLK